MPKIIVIAGATASGKSSFAVDLAKKNYGQEAVIINADSMQVYREIPITTAQPSDSEQAGIEHKLYGFLPASESFSVGKWLELACAEIDSAHKNGKTPILVGGTGMYLSSLINGISEIPNVETKVRSDMVNLLAMIGNRAFHKLLEEKDPIMADRLHYKDSQRMTRAMEVILGTNISLAKWQEKPLRKLYDKDVFECYFLNPPRETLYDNCNKRFLQMVENGAIEEVENLLNLQLDKNMPAMKALGVPEFASYLSGQITLSESVEKAQSSTRKYAKRQVTWFKNQLSDYREIKNL